MLPIFYTAILLFSVLFSNQAWAAIIRVPDDQENIENAVDSAEPGDTVLVEDGEYSGAGFRNIMIDIPLVVMSENGREECVIDIEGEDKAFGLYAPVSIIGFTLLAADTTIAAFNARDIRIEDCLISDGTALGIFVTGCPDITIKGSEIQNIVRQDDAQGAGMRIENSRGYILNCIVANNSTLGSGGGIYIRDSDFHIQHSIIADNFAQRYAGGIFLTAASVCTLDFCQVLDNSIVENNGAGFSVTEGSNLVLRNSIVNGNSTPRSGAGIYVSGGSEFWIDNTIFSENECDRSGGGIFVYNSSQGTIKNSLFINNSAGIDGGGVAVTSNSFVDVINCDLLENVAGVQSDNGMGGGIYMGSATTPVVLNSIIRGNQADIGEQIYAQAAGDLVIHNNCLEDGIDPDDNWDYTDIDAADNIDEDPEFVEGPEPDWGLNGFYLDAESACIDAGNAPAADIGMDTLTTQNDLSYDTDEVDIGFHYAPRWYWIFGRLFGTVTDFDTGDEIENAQILTSFGQTAVTDADGNWELVEALAFPFNITASHADYNSLTLEDRLVEEDGELELNFELLRPLIALSRQDIRGDLNLNDTVEVNLEIINEGNADLVWMAVPNEESEFVPWEQRYTGDPIGGLKGVVFTGDHFIYSISGEEENTIQVFDREGNLVDSFEQPGESEDGMLDLAWDGTLLWGSGEQNIYGFDLAGEVEVSFPGPRNPTVALAWDRDLQVLWAAGRNSDFIAYDRQGNRSDFIGNPGYTITGLAYWNRDPDGFNLYVLHEAGGDNEFWVNKLNTANGFAQFVEYFLPNGDRNPGGAFITNELFGLNYVFLSTALGEDDAYVDGKQVDAMRGWLTIEPDQGILEADTNEELTVTMNSVEVIEGVYEAEIIFTHNAIGGQTMLPVTMEVISGPVHTTRTIQLDFGWNLVSANLQPDEPDIRVLTRDLVDAGVLLRVKDQLGQFYYPARDFYNMDGWNVEEGYWILVNRDARLSLEGTTVRADDAIELSEGWQHVAYYPRRPIMAEIAFSGIVENLILAKDGDGSFYSPEFEFSNMGSCREGIGYSLKMGDADELVWGRQVEELDAAAELFNGAHTRHFSSPPATGFDMSLLCILPQQLSGEIAVTANDRIVGAGVIRAGKCGMAIRGDDPETSEIEGAQESSRLNLVIWDGNCERKMENFSVLKGEIEYSADAFLVIDATQASVPREFALYAAYPNPFNSITRIRFQTTAESDTRLAVYDVSGREIVRLVDRRIQPGMHSVAFNASAHPSGMYFARLTSGEGVKTIKMTCLK